nr:NUDIX domain-containing protein [Tamaricihabitans halophyticus]
MPKATADRLARADVVVGAAIWRAGELLAQQRAFPARDAGRWELPGGRVEPGETDGAALRRECHEELGVDVIVGAELGVDVLLPSGSLLRVYHAALVDPHAEPRAREHRALRWLSPAQLDDVSWLDADLVLLPALRASADAGKA